MIGQGVNRQPTASRDQKKCKFEAAFKSMQQQAGPVVVVGGGVGPTQAQSKREANAAGVEEEKRKRERMEFLLQLVCWGPD
ncbi:MSP domain-containing protein [Psidium guajava]|nr:MSP domain-containing protein [Psidium guajava]